MNADLFDRRAVLFLPASRPSAIERARASMAELVILDLEDAVKPEDKEGARAAAVSAVGESWPMPLAVRVNGIGSAWHDDDLAALAASPVTHLVLPLVDDPEDIERVASASGKPVLAMIETARGVLTAQAIAHKAAALIVGTNDLAADLRLPAGAGRGPLQTVLQSVLLAARAARIPATDGVFNRLDDPEGFAAECAESRRLGFDGKSLIHPDHIAACLAAFAPTPEEIARAERLVAAATGGAERFENAMIETMHVEAARRLLQRNRSLRA
ncbi:MAG: CoA ester lyase [Sphingomicrobium sp.]|nr:CoA ester lyase [Sphingomonadales bacterium]